MYRLPDHPVIEKLEREGWPLEPLAWWPEDEYADWEEYGDYEDYEDYGKESEDA